MLAKLYFFTLLLIFCLSGRSPEIANGVVQLTAANFDNFIQTHEHVFVKFYSKWCGHCKSMKEDYEQAAQLLTSEGVYLAEVDAEEEAQLQQRFQITGFPSLKFFVSGQSSEYNGGRTKDEIIQWLRKKLGPSSLDLVSTEDVEQAVADNEVVVVYFGEREGKSFKLFEQVGKKFDDIIFGIAKEGDKFGIDQKAMPVIKMFKKFDEREVVYDKSMEEEEQLAQWIDYHWMEKLFNFTYRTAEKIFTSQKPVLFFFIDFKNPAHQEIRKNVILQVSEQLRGKIIISESQVEEGMGERLAEFMNINQTMLPAVRIMQTTDTEVRRFVFNKELTVEQIKLFYNQWKDGKLKSVYKSEPVPTDNEQRVIKKVVSDNFDTIVRDNSKNVILMISAPWCNPCQEARPELETLVKIQPINDLIVGEMDATENEVEGLIIEGFPAVKYYPKNEKYLNINFDGERNKAGFIKFLEEYHQADKKGKGEKNQQTKDAKDEL